MSNATTYCPYEVGPPSEWLGSAGLEYDRKACAVPLGLNCGLNADAIETCCLNASRSQNSTGGAPYSLVSGTRYVCALPVDASNATFQMYQNCLLNYPGRDGGFRCNDVTAINTQSNCYSLNSVLTPPVRGKAGQQVCALGAVANGSDVMSRCCGSEAVAYDQGCYQYCIATWNESARVGRCIADGMREKNITVAGPGCFNGSADSSSTAAMRLDGVDLVPTLGLVATVAWLLRSLW